MAIGILALQGGYAAHASVLQRLDVASVLVRTPESLSTTSGLILPGGESSTFIRLLRENGLWHALCNYPKPIFGTCAGAILLAQEVSSPTQDTLGRIAISMQRNAYGRQLASQILQGHCSLTQDIMEMVLIRAPKITIINKQRVKALCTTHQGHAMAVQEGHCMAAVFHPELGTDDTLHTHFLRLCA